MFTQSPNQSLCHHSFNGSGNQERFDSHVAHSSESTGRVIGVQRAEDQVAGQRCLNRTLGSFQVTNFPHQHDVWVVAKDTSQ